MDRKRIVFPQSLCWAAARPEPPSAETVDPLLWSFSPSSNGRFEVFADPSLLAIAMTTARRDDPTLLSSLHSLRRAGFDQEIHLFAEPDSVGRDWRFPNVTVHRNRRRLGCYPNWLQAAGRLADGTDAPFLMICEDDGAYCRCASAALQYALQNLREFGCLSLYTPVHNYLRGNHKELGWFQLRSREKWGTVSHCFPRSVLISLLDEADAAQKEGTDRHVAAFLDRKSLAWYSHAPSLADHVGYASTLEHAATFANDGIGFDPDFEEYRVVERRRSPSTPGGSRRLNGTSKPRQDASQGRSKGRERKADATSVAQERESQTASERKRKRRRNDRHGTRSTDVACSGTTVNGTARSVSIVIAARNYGRYLKECITSALAQTIPCEIVYSDDASTDESVRIARRFESRGVCVVEGAVRRGVCVARNRGAAATGGEYLLFVDGDDVLPADFVEKHLAAFDPNTPFVYGPALAFGDGPDSGTFWRVPDWRNHGELWRRNFCNTSSMIRRWAFEAAGRWCDGAGSYWDWDLFLRASRFGRPRPSEATLNYRQHPESWSRRHGERHPDIGFSKMGIVRRLNARLTIAAVYSGRLAGLLPKWLEAIANSVAECPLPDPPELVILDNSEERRESRLRDAVRRHYSSFASIRVIPHQANYAWTNESERRDRVARFMAGACNRLQELARNELTWIIEDDVVVPVHSCRLLWEEITEGALLTTAAAGVYRNRHAPARFVGGFWNAGQPVEIDGFPNEAPLPVDFAGTGCLMYWKDLGADRWRSHVTLEGMSTDEPGRNRIPAHDWAWCMDVTRHGGVIKMLPSARCRHYQTETSYV